MEKIRLWLLMATLETWKTRVDILESVVQTLAIIIAGAWAIWRFGINREKEPKAEIQHAVESIRLGDEHQLIHVAITVKNISSVLMEPALLLVRLLQVLPLDENLETRLARGESIVRSDTRQGDWAGLGEYELRWQANEIQIEPTESHTFFFDFDVPNDISIFQVYSYLKNPMVGNKDLGWSQKTMHKNEDEPISVKQSPPEPPPRPPKVPVPGQAGPEPPPRKPTPPSKPPKK